MPELQPVLHRAQKYSNEVCCEKMLPVNLWDFFHSVVAVVFNELAESLQNFNCQCTLDSYFLC